MTIRTFWTILLKILGISLVVRGIYVILNLITTLSMVYDRHETGGAELIRAGIAVFGVVLVYSFILWLFVFKTSWLIRKLQLEKGFNEERIDLNIQLSTILTIAVIVIGGIMIIDSLPQLCQQVFMFFQGKWIFNESPAAGWIILHGTKLILGYLLMTNSRTIVKFINKRSSENPGDNDTDSTKNNL